MAHNLLNADTIMIDTNKPELSDEVWINPRSKFYVEEVFEHEISVSLNGKEHFDVEEYYISEIWIKVAVLVAALLLASVFAKSIEGVVLNN